MAYQLAADVKIILQQVLETKNAQTAASTRLPSANHAFFLHQACSNCTRTRSSNQVRVKKDIPHGAFTGDVQREKCTPSDVLQTARRRSQTERVPTKPPVCHRWCVCQKPPPPQPAHDTTKRVECQQTVGM